MAAALVTVTPIRLPAADGVPPSVRLVEANTWLFSKMSPAPPIDTAPIKPLTEFLRVSISARRLVSAAIFASLAVTRFSRVTAGSRLAAMMAATVPTKSMPDERPENDARPALSMTRLSRFRAISVSGG